MKVVVELCSESSDTTHPVTTFHNARIHSCGHHVHVVSVYTLFVLIILLT